MGGHCRRLDQRRVRVAHLGRVRVRARDRVRVGVRFRARVRDRVVRVAHLVVAMAPVGGRVARLARRE